ncbi:M60 family peptidase N-terminal accessory domain-containing protein [Spiroplasma endosymbiont of Tiphia femorata]|uniref:M60 family peptidase N-terminal accessory domain-containing protein n=1 Tax=Spiroplasma endosymbiont of Tiphia femorata TaxID=3066326 RepID=UPI0030D2CBFE
MKKILLRNKEYLIIPTGIFVVKGSKITIKLLENDESLLSIFIGQWGSYKNLNDGQSLKPKEYVINEENQTIISEIEGMLYLYNKSESTDYEVLITAESEVEDPTFVTSKIINKKYNETLNNNINSRFAKIIVEDPIEVPTFVVDTTTNEEFQQMLYDNIESPFVEIIGEHVFGTFQMELAKELWIDEDPNNYNINETFTRLDKVYELTSTVSGLNLEYNGIARKVNNKKYILQILILVQDMLVQHTIILLFNKLLVQEKHYLRRNLMRVDIYDMR